MDLCPISSKAIGMQGELHAKNFLIEQGLTWICSNYVCRFGEIDLIMQDRECLVFVEVRQRRSMTYGGALASVTWSKQKKIIRAVLQFQQSHQQWRQFASRIDVLTLQGVPPTIEWIQNAISS